MSPVIVSQKAAVDEVLRADLGGGEKNPKTTRFCRCGATPTPEKSDTRTVDEISPPYLSSSSHQFSASLLFPSPKEYSPVNEQRPLLLLSPHTLSSLLLLLLSPDTIRSVHGGCFSTRYSAIPPSSNSSPVPVPTLSPAPHTRAHARTRTEREGDREGESERDAIQ